MLRRAFHGIASQQARHYCTQHEATMVSIPKEAPVARTCDFTYEQHGQVVADEYAWLREPKWPKVVTEDPEILGHLKKENAYFESFMEEGEKKALKDGFFNELKGRIKLTDQTTYRKRDEYYYYSRTEEAKDYPILCRKKGSTDSPEEIYLDENKIAEGKAFCNVSSTAVSPDHTLLAYDADYTGGEVYTIFVKDLATGELRDGDAVEKTLGGATWHANGEGFFYTPVDDKWRTHTLMYHKLGTPSSEDVQVFHEPDPLFHVQCERSTSKEVLFVEMGGHDAVEYRYIDMSDMSFTVKMLHPRTSTVKPRVDHNRGFFYKRTNEDSCTNFKVLRAASEGFEAGPEAWSVYREEHAEKCLTSMDLSYDYILLTYNNFGLSEMIVRELATGEEKTVSFPDKSYEASVHTSNAEENDLRVNYSSLALPKSQYRYDFTTDKLDLLKRAEIPSGHNPDDYVVDRIFAETDGVRVPVTVLYAKGKVDTVNGTSPCYLTGYGSYGYENPPCYRNVALSLASRGYVFAIAHIRGGSDLGHHWYEQAKFLNKKRTFNDFVASAEALIGAGLASKGNIAMQGGSAGGMLMGACMNMRPDLWRGVIAHVPFVDVVQVMLDEDLPLTPGEFKEWGNPKEKEYFEYMMTYSPYDNLKKEAYPHVFVTAGLSDPRVAYWEAAKYVARLRRLRTNSDTALTLLKTNLDTGHGGASGRFDYLKEVADDLVFLETIFAKN